MRRFNYELKIIENEAKKISYQEMSNIFHYVKSIYGNTVPTNNDLQGAARALIRLQVMYRYRYMSINILVIILKCFDIEKFRLRTFKLFFRFNVSEFAVGNIMGLQTGAKLVAQDVFFFGRFAFAQNKPELALGWLKEAVRQLEEREEKELEETEVSRITNLYHV